MGLMGAYTLKDGRYRGAGGAAPGVSVMAGVDQGTPFAGRGPAGGSA